MKKVFVAVAMVMGLGTTVAIASENVNEVQVVMQVNEFAPIEVKDLPQPVQDTLKKDFPEQTIKAAFVEVAEDESKTFKVVLVNAEGAESEVFLNEKGEVLK